MRKSLFKEWPRNSLRNVQGNIVCFYFSRDCDSRRRVASHNTGTNTDHMDFSTNSWPRKERHWWWCRCSNKGRSLLHSSFLTEECSRSCPVILLSNSEQLWQFKQNRLTKFGHGSLTTALLMIQLNTLENFTVSGSQQRSTAWVLCLEECLFPLSLEVSINP